MSPVPFYMDFSKLRQFFSRAVKSRMQSRTWQRQQVAGNESVPKIIINNTIKLFFLNYNRHNSFRVLFDKIASVHFIGEIYLYFSIGNG